MTVNNRPIFDGHELDFHPILGEIENLYRDDLNDTLNVAYASFIRSIDDHFWQNWHSQLGDTMNSDGFFPKLHKVIVLGCGGTGSILIPQLMRYLYSLKYDRAIILVDGDTYAVNNMSRQSFNANFVGMNKAEYQAKAVAALLPEMSSRVEYIDRYLPQAEIEELIEDGTVVINCTDNIAARKFVEDACLRQPNAAHICCGNELFDGQVQLSFRHNGVQITPSIYEAAPYLNSTDDDRSAMNCEQLARLESGGQIICANMTAAAVALNYFYQLTAAASYFKNNTVVPQADTAFDCQLNKFGPLTKKSLSNEGISGVYVAKLIGNIPTNAQTY